MIRADFIDALPTGVINVFINRLPTQFVSTVFGSRGFCVVAPRAWNDLPKPFARPRPLQNSAVILNLVVLVGKKLYFAQETLLHNSVCLFGANDTVLLKSTKLSSLVDTSYGQIIRKMFDEFDTKRRDDCLVTNMSLNHMAFYRMTRGCSASCCSHERFGKKRYVASNHNVAIKSTKA